MQARRRAQPSGTNSPSSSHPRWKAPSAMRDLLSVPAMRPPGSPRRRGSWQARILEPRGERPPRARPQRRGSPGPIPNPAVKPAFAESTAARGCGRAGRRARGGRFSYAHAPRAPGGARGGGPPLRASPRLGASERPVKEIVFFQVLSAFRAPTPWMTASLISAVAGFLLAMMSLD